MDLRTQVVKRDAVDGPKMPEFADRDGVIEWLMTLLDGMSDVQRALVATVLVDNTTIKRLACIRYEAIFRLTRRHRSRQALAAFLGMTVRAIDKAVELRNRQQKMSDERQTSDHDFGLG